MCVYYLTWFLYASLPWSWWCLPTGSVSHLLLRNESKSSSVRIPAALSPTGALLTNAKWVMDSKPVHFLVPYHESILLFSLVPNELGALCSPKCASELSPGLCSVCQWALYFPGMSRLYLIKRESVVVCNTPLKTPVSSQEYTLVRMRLAPLSSVLVTVSTKLSMLITWLLPGTGDVYYPSTCATRVSVLLPRWSLCCQRIWACPPSDCHVPGNL